MAVEHLAEQPFALAAPHLEARRQPPGQLDDAVIEDRHAHLERDRHAGAIDLGENVVGKISQRVEILHALEPIGERALDRGDRKSVP